MDFTFTEEQQLLRDSIARLVANEYGFEDRKRSIAGPKGWSDAMWTQFADMGLLGVPFAESHGGFGGSMVDVMVVMQEFGRGIVVEPYLSTVVLGGGLVELAGSAAQKGDILPRVAAGKWLLAAAYGEPGSRYDLHDVATTAKKDGGGYVLNGRKSVVLHGGSANTLVVSARTAGGQRERQGITLLLVDAKMRGVTVSDARTVDGLRAADVALDGVHVGAESVLGQPIGRFQALQHRAVDMLIHAEQTKSMACVAAVKSQSADPAERRRAVSAAKSLVGRAGRAVAKEAVQLHGGMGVTNELPAAHYAKRLTMIDFWLGDADWHTERFAAG